MLRLALPCLLALHAAAPRDVVSDAAALVEDKRWEQAAELLHGFHQREPGTQRSHALFGQALHKLKRMDEASHHLGLALKRMEEAGQGDSREYRNLRALLAKADPLAGSRDAFFRKLVKTLVDAADALAEDGHHERALDVLERLEPFASASKPRDRERLVGLLEEIRARFAEVDLDEAGGGEVEEARPLVEVESERYLVSANLEPEVAELVGQTMDDIFLNYIQVYFDGDDGRVSDRKATIRIHPDHASMMEEWSDPSRSVGGWWSPGEWRVVCYDTRGGGGSLDQMLETLFHEASHQFMTMRSRGGRAPSWLNEGTASFFEGATAMSDGRVLWPGAAPGRLLSLASMLRNRSGPDVRQVVSYEEPGSYPGEYYPFGWGLVYFLQQYEDPETLEYVWRPYYQRYLEHITTRGGSSMKLFEELILDSGNPGDFADFDAFASAWEAWILEQVWPLHFGDGRRDLGWGRIERYLEAADGGGRDGPGETELLLRALGQAEKLLAAGPDEAPDRRLLLLTVDLFERLDRKASAAARIEEILALAEAGDLELDADLVADLDQRMSKLDRRNYPLRSLRTKIGGLSRAAEKLLARYEKRKDPLHLRSWSFAREAAAALDDQGPLLAAADRLRAAAREAGLVPSRILRVEGGDWATLYATAARDFEARAGGLTVEMPALQAAAICRDLEVQGEYELRATLSREGELYRSSKHGLVIGAHPEGDAWIACVDLEGRLLIKRVERAGGGTNTVNVAIELLYPAFKEDESSELRIRVQPEGRLRISVGERLPLSIDLPEPLPSPGHVGYYVMDGRLTLSDFVVEIFP